MACTLGPLWPQHMRDALRAAGTSMPVLTYESNTSKVAYLTYFLSPQLDNQGTLYGFSSRHVSLISDSFSQFLFHRS